MKEKDTGGKNEGQNELTNQSNSSNLEREGDIFMAEGNGGPEQEGPKPEETGAQETPPEASQPGPTPTEGPKRKSRARRQQQSPSPEPSSETPPETGDNLGTGSGRTPTPDSSTLSQRERELTQRLIDNEIARQAEAAKLMQFAAERIDDPELRKKMEEAGFDLKKLDPTVVAERVLEFKERAAETRRNIEERIREAERRSERREIYVPKSLEELAQLVENRATPEYRRDNGDGKRGEKCLFKEDGSVDTINFLDWARNNYFLVHLNNPTAPVNFFSDIATNIRSEGIGSTISFYEITFTESYYLKEVKDKNGKVTGYVENEEYKALKNQMLMEVFLLQLQRNPAVTHVLQSRSEREKMLNGLAEAFASAPLTRSNFMETILSQPSMHGESIYDQDKTITEIGDLQKKIEGNFLMGDATREALTAYMNIYSYEQLVKIFGKDSPLFRYAYDKWDWVSAKPAQGTPEETTLKTVPDLKDTDHPDKRRTEWFYTQEDINSLTEDEKANLERLGITVEVGALKLYKMERGKVKKDSWKSPGENASPHQDFMKYINVFLSPNPPQSQQDEIRERIRLSIMGKNGISYREAQIAELMAYSMAQVYGVAARNDVDSVAFDWWTRVQNFLDKRKREKSPTRNAPYGSKFNMEGFKRIGLNIFEAVRDGRRRSIREIVQGGTGERIDIKGNPLKNNVEFEKDKETGFIIFVDSDGKTVDAVRAKSSRTHHITRIVEESDAKTGKISRKEKVDTKIVFYTGENGEGDVVDVGEYKPKKVEKKRVEAPIEFNQAAQAGFLVNHLVTGSKIYEWIMYKKETALDKAVTGYDTYGHPELNWEEINKVKGTIEHDFRYLLSTWGEINYAERQVEWERVEVRDEKRRLVGKDNDEILDEDWYVIENGKRTNRRSEPKTFLRSREMSRLENMFGKEALDFIQYEIEQAGITYGDLRDPEKRPSLREDIISVEDERTGEALNVDLSAANSDNEEDRSKFRLAVWQGAFEYLLAAEIRGHRTRGSGDEYWDTNQLKRYWDALRVGQILQPVQISNMRHETNTRARHIYAQDFGYAFATGGMAGILKAIQIWLREAQSGK